MAVRLAPAQVFDAGVVDLAVWPELDLRVVVPAGAALPAYLRVTVPVARGVRGTGGPIDGKGVAKVRLPAGRTKLRFQADGYQPITLEVDNRPGAGPIRLEFTPR